MDSMQGGIWPDFTLAGSLYLYCLSHARRTVSWGYVTREWVGVISWIKELRSTCPEASLLPVYTHMFGMSVWYKGFLAVAMPTS